MKTIAWLLLATGSAFAQGIAPDPCLAGLKPSLQVLIEDMGAGTLNLGVTTGKVRADALLRLREAGFDILGASAALQPIIDVSVTTTPNSQAAFVWVEVAEPVIFKRSRPTTLLATSWRTGTVLSVPTEETIRQSVKDCIDRFLVDWFAANPARSVLTRPGAALAAHHE